MTKPVASNPALIRVIDKLFSLRVNEVGIWLMHSDDRSLNVLSQGNIVQELKLFVPELDSVSTPEEERLVTIYLDTVAMPFFQRVVKEEGLHDSRIKRLLEFFEGMANCEDRDVQGLLSITVIEYFLFGQEIDISELWDYLGPATQTNLLKTARSWGSESNLPTQLQQLARKVEPW